MTVIKMKATAALRGFISQDATRKLCRKAIVNTINLRDNSAAPRYGCHMRLLTCTVALLFVVPVLTASDAPNESDKILQLESEWCGAFQRGDAAAIAAALADDYTLTDSRGVITTKADDLEDAKTGKMHYDIFENEDMKVRTYGGATAIVTGKTKVKGTAEGKPVDVLVQFTDTLVKIDGRWRLVAGHVSRLRNEAAR